MILQVIPIILIVLSYTGFEIWRNAKIINGHGIVDHRYNMIIRIAPIFGIVCMDRLTGHEYYRSIVFFVTFFWFVFDYGLNWATGKYMDYLGGDSVIDRFQKNTLGEFPWFVFKGLFLISGISILLELDAMRG
jgi:hypothetical protein